MTYSSGWTTLVSPAYSGGSASQSDDNGQSARYAFTGRAIARRDVDGSEPRRREGVHRRRAQGDRRHGDPIAAGDRVVVYQYRFAGVGSHTIKVVSSNGTRPDVVLDAFARL